MSSPAKKQYGLIDPVHPPARAVRLGTRPAPDSQIVVDLFTIDGLYVDRREARGHWKEQFEMPLEGIAWMVQAIELGFERKPSEGGLPRDVFHTDTTIAGEHLQVRHGVNIGGEGVPGYTVHNWDRLEYITGRYAQDMSFTLEAWRETLRDFYKQLAERVASGEFSK